ncbi:DEAD/DEAH box helicase [Apilactobacillus kunkeei]|uniref:Helicase n=1 Tax=Apilactobacillus kunkeei TaxID=148814 RepID=A0AAC8WBE1_9LACO|nr:DEAD/DEAH box helicase family protein [Apilactobacillus kunkeei]ALJ31177.1 helicase [Apilactobacillus kunkeei]KFJ15774.1 helicase [Apilactobacillus kunkeei]TPR53943.1 DUF2075 domain-containing protein [Apilactobacillus kunkeei]
MVNLKKFQQDAVDKLLKFTSPSYNVDNLIIKAPTGSGKTIILLSWMEEYIKSTNDNVAFVWFTPGSGELEEQSKNKANNFMSIQSQSVDDALLNGFSQGTATFINYERVVGKKSKAMLTDNEHENLTDRVEEAFNDGRHFIVIIDEAHRNDTKKARNIISQFNASKVVKVSATIDNPNLNNLEFYEITETDVINSGLITKSVVVNEGIDSSLDGTDEFVLLFDSAESKRKEILSNYNKNGVQGVNPLVLVQLPDESTPELSLRIQKHLKESMGKTYDNRKLGIWLSEDKINVSNVTDLNSSVEYLIIKQAIATGWDAPRAKILIKIRENMGEKFTIQTLGRIRRMPQPDRGHYDVDVLDNAYLYTFDTDFLNGVFTQTSAVTPTPLLKLKDKAKDLELISERTLNNDIILNEKSIVSNIYKGIVLKFNLNESYENNRHILENNGYILGDRILTTFKQGRFDTMENTENLHDRERWIQADYNDNRIDLLHAYHEIDRVVHMPVSKVEAMLKRFFLYKKRPTKYTLLKQNDNEFTAFILNNWKLLRDEFRNIDVQQSIQGSLDINNIQEDIFSIPLSERYKYNPRKFDIKNMDSNAYIDYNNAITSVRPSLAERLLEKWIESHKDMFDFVYKNGDKGTQYFSLIYGTNGGLSHFYPDFIVRTNDKCIWIIETKGGEDKDSKDKNIDPYAPAKYESLKRYAEKHNVKWAFVRDMDEELFFLNTGEWIDDMRDNNMWNPIKNMFK